MAAIHKPWYIALIGLTVLVYIITLVINYLASSGPNALFHNSTGSIADYYYVELTPAGWTFAAIWSTIYLWQIAWLIYALTTICRRTIYGYLYVNPGHLPLAMYPCFIVNNVTNFTWLILWDRLLSAPALVVLFLSTISLYFALGFSFRKLYKTGMVLSQEKMKKDIWLTRILVQNGMAFYATWVTIATLINLCVVMTYDLKVDQSISSTVGLALLALIIAVWFFADNFALDKYVRYTWTPYIVIIIALSGNIAKNWDPQKNNPVLAVSLLAAVGLGFIIKVILTCWRHKTRPLFIGLPFFQESKSYGSNDYMEVSVK